MVSRGTTVSSPALQQSLQDGEVCRVAMSCHSRWTVGICPWNGKQGGDCRDAQIVRCNSTSASMQAWTTGERLLYVRLNAYMIHDVAVEWNGDCGKVCGSEARVTEALSGLDKARTNWF